MTDIEAINEEIAAHKRRLQKLREQKAIYGLSADPSLEIEIEDIEAKLKKLQADRQRLEGGDSGSGSGGRPAQSPNRSSSQTTIWDSRKYDIDIPTSATIFIERLKDFFEENLFSQGYSALAYLPENITEPVKFYLPTHGASLESMFMRGEAWIDEEGRLIISADPKFSGLGKPLEVKVIPNGTNCNVRFDTTGRQLINTELYNAFINFLSEIEGKASQPRENLSQRTNIDGGQVGVVGDNTAIQGGIHFHGGGSPPASSPGGGAPGSGGRRYDLHKVQALLNDVFSEEDLRDFCLYETDFQPVYDELKESDRKADILRRLISYARRNDLVPRLLEWARQTNATRYAAGTPYEG